MVGALIETLRARGAELTEHWSPRGHEMGDDDLDAAAAWRVGPS